LDFLHGTKYCNGAILAVLTTPDRQLPVFGVIKNIFVISDYVYFDVTLYSTILFEANLQSYFVEEISDEDNQYICSYESLVDYNVFHILENDGSLYVSVKYDIDDVVEEHCKEQNCLF